MINLIPVIVVPEDAEDIRRNVGHTKKVIIKTNVSIKIVVNIIYGPNRSKEIKKT